MKIIVQKSSEDDSTGLRLRRSLIFRLLLELNDLGASSSELLPDESYRLCLSRKARDSKLWEDRRRSLTLANFFFLTSPPVKIEIKEKYKPEAL